MYDIKQAGGIWGSLLVETFVNRDLEKSVMDERVLFLKRESKFVVICIVVDDSAFTSNSPSLLSALKEKLFSTFDVKLLGEFKSFIG